MKEQRNSPIFKIKILNRKWKDCKSRKNVCKKNFTYTKIFYVHEITAVNLSRIYLLENAKKTWTKQLQFKSRLNYRVEVSQLEIRDKFSSKLNVFSYMTLQCWLNILKSFINIRYGNKTQWLGSFAGRAIVCTTKMYLYHKNVIKIKDLHACSWCDKLIVLWTLNRQAKIFLRIKV